MNETQKLIKESIETETRDKLKISVVVEFVDDVSKRVQEIEKEYNVKFNSVYEADNLTGTFIPTVNDNPYHIIVRQNRSDMLDVMTAFHEYRHLLDFVQFKNEIFDGNIEMIKKSPLYVTFNVYSEYNATLFGVKHYIKSISFESISQRELAIKYLQQAKSRYENLEEIENRYQLLVHSMIYFGDILACREFIDDINVEKYLNKMELYNELKPIFINTLEFDNKKEWYEMNNQVMRTFVNGGVSV